MILCKCTKKDKDCKGKQSQIAIFVIREVMSVGNNDMIHEFDAHHVACLQNAPCQVIICLAGLQASRWVVMANGQDSGVAQYCLTNDDAHIDAYFRDATVGNA